MEHYHNFLVGIVIFCPMTNKQVAIHQNNVNFTYWNAGLGGHEADITIPKCPSCNTKHIITLSLST